MDSVDPRRNFGRIRNFGGAGEGENSDGSRTNLSRDWGWNWRCLVNSSSSRRPFVGKKWAMLRVRILVRRWVDGEITGEGGTTKGRQV